MANKINQFLDEFVKNETQFVENMKKMKIYLEKRGNKNSQFTKEYIATIKNIDELHNDIKKKYPFPENPSVDQKAQVIGNMFFSHSFSQYIHQMNRLASMQDGITTRLNDYKFSESDQLILGNSLPRDFVIRPVQHIMRYSLQFNAMDPTDLQPDVGAAISAAKAAAANIATSANEGRAFEEDLAKYRTTQDSDLKLAEVSLRFLTTDEKPPSGYISRALSQAAPELFAEDKNGIWGPKGKDINKISAALGLPIQSYSFAVPLKTDGGPRFKGENTPLSPANFDINALNDLHKSTSNPMWLVLKSIKPIGKDFTPKDKMNTYIELVSAYEAGNLGKTDKFKGALQVIRLAKAMAEQYPETQADYNKVFSLQKGASSTIAKWIIGKSKQTEKDAIATFLEPIKPEPELASVTVVDNDREESLSFVDAPAITPRSQANQAPSRPAKPEHAMDRIDKAKEQERLQVEKEKAEIQVLKTQNLELKAKVEVVVRDNTKLDTQITSLQHKLENTFAETQARRSEYSAISEQLSTTITSANDLRTLKSRALDNLNHLVSGEIIKTQVMLLSPSIPVSPSASIGSQPVIPLKSVVIPTADVNAKVSELTQLQTQHKQLSEALINAQSNNELLAAHVQNTQAQVSKQEAKLALVSVNLDQVKAQVLSIVQEITTLKTDILKIEKNKTELEQNLHLIDQLKQSGPDDSKLAKYCEEKASLIRANYQEGHPNFEKENIAQLVSQVQLLSQINKEIDRIVTDVKKSSSWYKTSAQTDDKAKSIEQSFKNIPVEDRLKLVSMETKGLNNSDNNIEQLLKALAKQRGIFYGKDSVSENTTAYKSFKSFKERMVEAKATHAGTQDKTQEVQFDSQDNAKFSQSGPG